MGLFDTTQEWDETLAAWQGIQAAPAKENRKRRQGIRVLKNNFLERFVSTSHWAMPGVWFIPLVVYCLWASNSLDSLGWATIAWVASCGVLLWTFIEYWLHRFFFHLPAGTGILRRTLLFSAHGYHHEFPSDPGRLVAPPMLSWPIGAILGILCYLIFGRYWHAVFAGLCIGYLAYDWTHYYTHHGKPKTRLGKFMRRFHLEHHFKDNSKHFGLSSPLWDIILGTYTKPGAPQKTEIECLDGKQV